MVEKMGAAERWMAGILTALVVVSLILANQDGAVGIVGLILLGLEGSYLLFSVGYINYNQVAAKYFLGETLGNLKPGPYFAPKWLTEVRKAKGTRHPNELPANPELVFHEDDKVALPPGMFREIRMKFGPPQPEDEDNPALADDPYHKGMVLPIVPVVIWEIARENATQFFATYEDEEEFTGIVADKVVGACGVMFAKMTPAKANKKLAEVNSELTTIVQAQLDDTGPKIIEVYLKPFGTNHDLNKEVILAAIEQERMKGTITRAQAERQKRILEGEGAAAARRAMIVAEAEGAERKAKLAGTEEGRIALGLEAAKAAFDNPSGTIITSGGDALSGVLASVGKSLGKLMGK